MQGRVKQTNRAWPGLIGWLFLLALVGTWLAQPAKTLAQAGVPPGFRLLAQQPGVALYRKDYPGGSPDFVQVVNLAAGASIDLLHGNPVAMNNAHNQGEFGGPNPSFHQKSIQSYWQAYASDRENAFCVTNGTFFYMPESPTPLALPLLVDHQLLAEGFGYPQYPEKQLILALWAGRADILPLTPEILASIDADQVIGGLTEEANKKPKNAVGRTFVGIWDNDGDQITETVAIYTTQTATQAEAARTVRSFGASKVMMLDGGGSTQLICQGQAYIDTTRAIPQALGVSAGVQAGLVRADSAPTVREDPPPSGEVASLAVENLGPENSTAQAVPQAPTQESGAGLDSGLSPQAPLPVEVHPVEKGQVQPGSQAIMPTAVPDSSGPMDEPALSQAPDEPALAQPQDEPSVGNVSPTSSALSASAPAASGSLVKAQANGLDVLLLPAIISPLSVLLIVIVRKQIFLLYRDG